MVVDIVIHRSKDESSLLAELASIDSDMTSTTPNDLFVTIIGVGAVLSINACESLLSTIRNFANAFPSRPRHVRLLRVDQRADWFHYFLSAIHSEGILATTLDLEIPRHFDPMILRCLEALLLDNQLKQLRVDSVRSPFEDESSCQRILIALQKNKSLESLWLHNFFPADSSIKMIRSFLSKPALRTVSLGEPDTLEESLALQKILSHPSCPIEELTMLNHSSMPLGDSQSATLTFDGMSIPNRSVKIIRLLSRGKVRAHQMSSILSSFVALEELYVPQSCITSLPMPTSRFQNFPTTLRVIDLTGSEIVYHWDSVDKKVLAEAYGSLLQYKIIFPHLQILGFPTDHRILRGYPDFIAKQKRISPSFWPWLFSLLSIAGSYTDGTPTQVQSADIYYGVLKIFLSHQALGLVPEANHATLIMEETCTKDLGDGSQISSLHSITNSQAPLQAVC